MSIIETTINETNSIDVLRDKLKTLLKELVLDIEFTKTDGTKRSMICTLKSDLIPEQETPTTTKRHINLSDEVVRVYDLEKEGWRSFRLDSINYINIA